MNRRVLLGGFLVSVVINAILGIWILLISDFSEIQGKVLATSFCVSGAMLGILINAAALTRRVRWPLPIVAAGSAVAGFCFMIVTIWAEPDSDPWWRSLATLFVIAASASLVCLLALVRLGAQYRAFSRAHGVVTGLLAATAISSIWAEADGEWVLRLIGIESVLVAALTLAIPALAFFGQDQSEAAADVSGESGLTRSLECPHCGRIFTISKAELSRAVPTKEPNGKARWLSGEPLFME